MAKKKKSKKTTSNRKYSPELIGLIIILIGIIGLGFGPIGNFIKEFAMFLTGELWFFVCFFVIAAGTYMILKRENPKFFTPKLIGMYFLFFVILSIAHFEFVDQTTTFREMMSITYDNFMQRINTINTTTGLLETGDSSIVIGGGILGSLVVGALASAFGKVGTIIVLVVITIFGIVLAFNLTLSEIFDKLKLLLTREVDEDEDNEEETPKKKKDKKHQETDEDEENNEGVIEIKDDEKSKIVVASIDDIKNLDLGNAPMEAPVTSTISSPVAGPISEIHVNKDDTPYKPADTPSFEKESPSYETASSEYKLPKFDILKKPSANKSNGEEAYIKSNQKALENVLQDFDINGKVVEIHIGPAVTEYEVKVPSGTKVNRVTNINKEIALAMAAKDVRIQAPIPGKSTIGIEIPNREIAAVNFREVLENTSDAKSENKILMALGKDIMGKCVLSDLTKTPHLLVAGSTGSGKSVCINTIIASILMRYKPNEVKLVLVDPKKVELSNYNGIPHLLCPVVSDPKRASATLQKIVSEMESRYDLFSEKEVKNIAGYNEWVEKQNKKSLDNQVAKMPYIVVIIDELADLMMVASKEVQDSIMRITQMARAAGIHLIVATQRPSTDIITGVIKSNIPSRIAFAVSSSIDSRTILDTTGAEKLLGKGDMLFNPMGQSIPTRIQGCFISDEEIHDLIEHCKNQCKVQYSEVFTAEDLHTSASGSSNSEGDDDPMYNEVVEFAVESGKISASLIQRRFRFGYNRAARLVDILESRGIIGPSNGSKPREVLIKVQNEGEQE